MKSIGAAAFKAKCLSVMKDVHDGCGEVVVTKRGKPFVKITPVAKEKPESIFGFLKGKARIVGDIVSPIVEPWEWDENVFPAATEERTKQAKSRPERSGRARRRA